ncbi:MAG: aspartate/glutamate racemase family protein, partial [Candidatus Competibacteraceae bacterium]|nr:aspartate/glutamate racemase family protein [Candidatus Competibacteraceae bacterium]
MPERILLGMLTPSSNTVLEPVTSAMLAGLPDASAHFGRFRVTEISLRDEALNQFDNAPLLRAAELLADARVNVIAWNGTSAGWLGFDADEALCRAITAATGIAACTSVLALNQALQLYGARRIGLVTPYLHNVQDKIIQNYSQSGFEIVAERHLNDPGNFSFSEVSATALRQMIYEVAASKPDAITTFCTNLRAAPLVEELEQEIGIPILDTISVVVWQSLRLAGADP